MSITRKIKVRGKYGEAMGKATICLSFTASSHEIRSQASKQEQKYDQKPIKHPTYSNAI